MALPSTTVEAELYCYGALVTRGDWTGVKIADLLTAVNAAQNPASIVFVAQDGYQVTISYATASEPNVVLAYSLNGSPIMESLRLVIPDANGNMWIALVTSVTLSIGGADNVVASTSGALPERPTDQTASAVTPVPHPTAALTPQITATPAPTASATLPPTSSPTSIATPQNTAKAPDWVYAAAAVVVAALALAGLAVVKHRKNKNQP